MFKHGLSTRNCYTCSNQESQFQIDNQIMWISMSRLGTSNVDTGTDLRVPADRWPARAAWRGSSAPRPPPAQRRRSLLFLTLNPSQVSLTVFILTFHQVWNYRVNFITETLNDVNEKLYVWWIFYPDVQPHVTCFIRSMPQLNNLQIFPR